MMKDEKGSSGEFTSPYSKTDGGVKPPLQREGGTLPYETRMPG